MPSPGADLTCTLLPRSPTIFIMDALSLNGQALTLAEIEQVAHASRRVVIAPQAHQRMAQSRARIESILAEGATVYGVNTGFGKLSDVRIAPEKLAELQTNLVRSHAGGVGQPLSEPESRAMLLLRANVLAKGFSGASRLRQKPAGEGFRSSRCEYRQQDCSYRRVRRAARIRGSADGMLRMGRDPRPPGRP